MKIVEKIAIQVPFKGNRDYLHSTDIYNQIFTLFPKIECLELSFFKRLTHPIRIETLSAPFDKANLDAYVELSFGNQRNSFGLFQDKDQLIQERIPYDENLVVAESKVETRVIYLDSVFKFTPIEVVVALNKRLLSKVLSSEIKWALTRLQITSPLIHGQYKLVLEKNLGFRLTKTAIYIDNIHYGYIYFSDFSGAFAS